MRLSMGKRLLTALAGLIILLFGVYLLIFGTGLFTPKLDLVALADSMQLWHRLVLIVGAVLLCALGVEQLGILFRRRGDKGFVMQHTELGDMSISMDALNTMVHKCVEQHREINVKSTKIDRDKDGITIEIRILLEAGVNIPLTVNALQKQIKQYITSSSGVDVHTVKVLVETDASKTAAVLAAPARPDTKIVTEPLPAQKPVEQPAATQQPSTPEAEQPLTEAAPQTAEEAPVVPEPFAAAEPQPAEAFLPAENAQEAFMNDELYVQEAAAEATTGQEAALEGLDEGMTPESNREEARE